jgi:hypothetical protein
MNQGQDEPIDQEAIYAIAHLAGQAASELKALDKLALGSSPNMKGLQFEPQELIRQNFLPRMQANGAPPASANYRMRAPQPGTAPRPPFQPPQHQHPQQPPQQMMQPQPQQMMQPVQQAPQVFAGISPNISEAQISLLMEKLLRVERLLDSCVSGQERLQTTLDKSLEKLLQKKMKDIKITFKDDNTDSQQE